MRATRVTRPVDSTISPFFGLAVQSAGSSTKSKVSVTSVRVAWDRGARAWSGGGGPFSAWLLAFHLRQCTRQSPRSTFAAVISPLAFVEM